MTDHHTCEIAVVGGGPAGATAAYLLAGAGLKVTLFDRQCFPRPKLCAGLLTWKTVQLVEKIFGLSLYRMKEDGLILHSCRDYKIFFNSEEIARGRLVYPFHLVDRSHYDHYWLRAARQAGARIETGLGVKQVDPEAMRLALTDGRSVSAKIIIGADGVWSNVRRSVLDHATDRRRWRYGLAATIETFQQDLSTDPGSNHAALHFGAVPWGYGWSFPRGEHRILGLATLQSGKGRSVRRGFDTFLSGMAVDGQRIGRLKGYPLPYGNYLSRPARGGLLLAGDACGLADPLLGEGIYYAHRSAQLAASSIIDQKKQWHRCAPAYNRAFNRHLLRELRWIHLFRSALFVGGTRRRYRGLKLLFRLFPKRLEAAVQGHISFGRLLVPGTGKLIY